MKCRDQALRVFHFWGLGNVAGDCFERSVGRGCRTVFVIDKNLQDVDSFKNRLMTVSNPLKACAGSKMF